MLAEPKTEADDKAPEGLLDVADLVRMFEESENSTADARALSERDRDYVDNIQLTAEELAVLAKRGQPPSVDNLIKTKIDYLVGFEKQQRIEPKAMPRTPKHEEDADGATQGLRYVAESEDYSQKRSSAWRNMLVEGSGGIRVYVEPSKYAKPQDMQGMMASSAMTPPQEMEIKVQNVPWDRMFADPHASALDYSDAAYKGIVLWMDYDDALSKYSDNPDAADILDSTMDSVPSDTYDDKPKFSLWADKKRKRVRICQIWVKRGDDWHFAEYTKGGILKAGPSPHKDDQGGSDDELEFQAAYRNRDNETYGLVREMVPLQDEVNKRRSKSLHLLSVHQTTYEEGAIDDIEAYRREKAKPDGTMKVAPGALRDQRIVSEFRVDLAEGHFKLLQEAKNSIELKGPNATEMGDKTGGSSAASGKAIIASQQGGMTQIGDLMDGLRHLDKRVFRKMWNRIRQYWTAEKWIRITDDERNIKWLGLNVDPMQMQMLMQQNPQAAQKIAGVVGNVAELDCDIILDASPDGVTPALEQFQALVELKKFDAQNELPFRAIVSAMPNLKDKAKFLDALDEQAKARQGQPNPEMAKAEAEMKAEAQKAQMQQQLQGIKIEADAEAAERKAQRDTEFDKMQAAIEAQLARDKAEAESQLARDKANAEIKLKREIAEAEARLDREKAERSLAIEAMKAKAGIDNQRRETAEAAE